MLRLDGVAVHRLAREIGVDGVQVQAVAAGEKFIDQLEVLAELVEGARLAGIVAGGLDAAGKGGVGLFKPADVVALPAVQRDGRGGEGGERGVHIDAQRGVGGGRGGKSGGGRVGGTGFGSGGHGGVEDEFGRFW